MFLCFSSVLFCVCFSRRHTAAPSVLHSSPRDLRVRSLSGQSPCQYPGEGLLHANRKQVFCLTSTGRCCHTAFSHTGPQDTESHRKSVLVSFERCRRDRRTWECDECSGRLLPSVHHWQAPLAAASVVKSFRPQASAYLKRLSDAGTNGSEAGSMWGRAFTGESEGRDEPGNFHQRSGDGGRGKNTESVEREM